MHVTCLIGKDVRHQGAGSIHIDNAFSEAFLDELEALFAVLPIAQSERGTGEVIITHGLDDLISLPTLSWPYPNRTLPSPNLT